MYDRLRRLMAAFYFSLGSRRLKGSTVSLFAATCCFSQVPGGAAAPAPAPPPHWGGVLTASIQTSRGQSDVDGISITAQLSRPSKFATYEVEGLYMYTGVAVPGHRKFTTAQNRRAIAFTASHQANEYVSLLNRASMESDELRGLDHRFMDMMGVRFSVPKWKRTQLAIAPGIAFGNERKAAFPELAGVFVTPAIFESVKVALDKTWSVDQFVLYRSRVGDPHDYQIDGFVGLTGALLVQRLGMHLGYRYTYEGLVGPGLKRVNSQFTVGLSLKI